jgi:hypothetical protein
MKSLQIYDIFVTICKELPIKQIVTLELISNYHKNIIKNYEWYHDKFTINTENDMKYCLINHNFRNLRIHTDANIVISYMNELVKCHTIILDLTHIRNDKLLYKYVKKFKDCHTFHIYEHLYLKHKTLVKFKNCYSLNLFDSRINTKSIKYLGNIQILCFGCNHIKNKHLKYLKNCHTLDLFETRCIKDKNVKYLKNCHSLNIRDSASISEENKKLLSDRCFKVKYGRYFL